jgi:hypothetical protein
MAVPASKTLPNAPTAVARQLDLIIIVLLIVPMMT